ncbi:MAG: MBOAT family protein [Bacteroidales bacterium]|nr:MBOAT family protein [Bacteroidales bacterium]
MLFNSLDFAIFLPILFVLYWFVFRNRLKAQNILLLLASYVFYGWWDYRFLSLIFFSSIIDYVIGLLLMKEDRKLHRKVLVGISLGVNLGLLGFFKYYNFFLESFTDAFTFLGYTFEAERLSIILPVGISFYTFQTLSYSLDVYARKLEPTRNMVDFMAYVSFFPQLVAGPIERAKNLLPQFYVNRTFDYGNAVDGLRQILWGLFKKVVIADNAASIVEQIYSNSGTLDGSSLFLGTLFFAFQIYGDFSGYSDIAIGTGRLFGFSLMQNFAFPYFSRDIAEFWRRWHISLTTWFRDYVYIPLGGSRGSVWKVIRNTLIVFVVSGFWHGANWTFTAWGLINALFFLPLIIQKNHRKNIDVVAAGKWLPSWKDLMQMISTFCLALLAWVFFRSDSIAQSFEIFGKIFSSSLFNFPPEFLQIEVKYTLGLIGFMVMVEWFGREEQHALARMTRIRYRSVRWLMYCALIILMVLFMQTKESPFIYFQF